jgi:hypothetical protein
VFTERQFDFTVLRSINVIGFKGLHERRRLREPRLEIGKGLLRVVMFWHFDTVEPRGGSLGEVGCNLYLANKTEACQGKPVIEALHQSWCTSSGPALSKIGEVI